jgi:hypothetical protein
LCDDDDDEWFAAAEWWTPRPGLVLDPYAADLIPLASLSLSASASVERASCEVGGSGFNARLPPRPRTSPSTAHVTRV